jgi:hypothetical protein
MMRPDRFVVWLADELLDRIPAYEQGRWYLNGEWGCRLRLYRYWWAPDEPC